MADQHAGNPAEKVGLITRSWQLKIDTQSVQFISGHLLQRIDCQLLWVVIQVQPQALSSNLDRAGFLDPEDAEKTTKVVIRGILNSFPR